MKYGISLAIRYGMNKTNYEYENNVEVIRAEISEIEYNERVCRVIKCLLEMSLDSDKTRDSKSEEAA
jgi:hypothetical protein